MANLTPDEIDAAYMDYLDNHASHEERVAVGIPVKVNIVSGGSRTAFRSEGEQQSERSDAGMVIWSKSSESSSEIVRSEAEVSPRRRCLCSKTGQLGVK